MLREWVYSRLTGYSPLVALNGDRVWLATALESIPSTKPFIIYRVGLSTSSLRGDGLTRVLSSPIQVFIHDDPGDYARIDQMLRMARVMLEGGSSSEHGIISCDWIEDSEDLRDDEFHTNLRWGRFQVTHEE